MTTQACTPRRKPGPKGPRPDTRPTAVVTARIDADLAAWIDAQAAALDLSRSELIEEALRARQRSPSQPLAQPIPTGDREL